MDPAATIPFADVRANRAKAAHEAWADLALAVRRTAERLIDSEGRETVENLSLRHGLARMDAKDFPVEADSARKTAAALLLAGRAAIGADLPELRARIAPAAMALAEAIDGLLADRLSAETARWRAHLGEES